jgi:hypothetical protein
MDFDPGVNTRTVTHAGGGDTYLVRYDSSGKFDYVVPLGSSGQDIANGLALTTQNRVLLAGAFSSSLDFDPSASTYRLSSAGDYDGFILSINNCVTSYDTTYQIGCKSYTSPSGKYTWISSGSYSDTMLSVSACDSIININLIVVKPNTTVTANDPVLSSNATGVSYQWLDCNNSYAPILGETKKSFTASANGSYAVEVTQNRCADTSACYQVITIGLEGIPARDEITIYPNPIKNAIYFEFPNTADYVEIELYDGLGKQLMRISEKGEMLFYLNTSSLSPGIYFVKYSIGDNSRGIKKILKVH